MSLVLWIALAIVGAAVLFLVVLPLAVLWFAGPASAEGVSVDIAVPPKVHRDQPLEFAITINNALDRPRRVRSIDFDTSLHRAFSVESITPLFVERSSMLGTTAYHFQDLTIPSRGSITVRLTCKVMTPGEFSGLVAVFVDRAHTNSVDTPIQIVVS